MVGSQLKVDVHIDGLPALQLSLSRMERAANDLRWLWPYYKTAFHAVESRMFAAEGGESKWAPLSEAYAAWKAKNYPGPILTLTGVLRDSLTTDGDYSVFEPHAQWMAIGTSVPYANYHQYGTRKMPARPPLQIPRKYRGEFALAGRAASEEFRKAWGR